MQIRRILIAAKDFKELIGLGGFYLLLIAHPLSPDLEISHDKSNYYVDSLTEEDSRKDSKDLSILTLIIANKSKQPITDIELEIGGVVQIDRIGGRSSSIRLNNEIDKLLEYEEREGYQVFFKNINDLPAGHNIQIQIIGSYLDLIIKDRINVTSSAKSISITEMAKVTGLWVFVYSQATTLFSVLATFLIFIGIKRFYKEGVNK